MIGISLAVLLFVSVYSAANYYFYNSGESSENTSVMSEQCEYTVVIDAGHGGEDGGAVGRSGIPEKDINLSVSYKLYDMLTLFGVNAVMTREDDRLLYGEGQENRKKFYDVRNRVNIVNNSTNPILISVHQNKFPLEKYFGLQVYYSQNNDGSRALANILQNKAKEHLIKGNNRNIKGAGRNIYLLHNLECPAILVECGFLSNREEEALLISSEYQRKISFTVFSSVMDYVSGNV